MIDSVAIAVASNDVHRGNWAVDDDGAVKLSPTVRRFR